MTRLQDKIFGLGAFAKVAALATVVGAAPALGATVTQTVSTSGVSGQYVFDFTSLLAAEALNGNSVSFTGGTITFEGESAANVTPDEFINSFTFGPYTLNLFEAGDRVNDIVTLTYGSTVLSDDTEVSPDSTTVVVSPFVQNSFTVFENFGFVYGSGILTSADQLVLSDTGLLTFGVSTLGDTFQTLDVTLDATYSLVPIAPVPLPASGALLLVGMGGAALIRRRKATVA